MRGVTVRDQRAFTNLWAGHTVGQLGTFVGQTVVPLLAATALAATPLQMGLLTAAGTAAFLLVGLPAGVWVDHLRRRPLMVGADLARAVLLLTVPVCWWLDVLTFAQLLVVALLVSVSTVFFDVASQSYLPSVVGRANLVSGNSRLQSSMSVAEVVGPGAGGGLTQLVGAAGAALTTSLGYLVSAIFLLRINVPESPPAPRGHVRLRTKVAEGLRFVFADRTLRAIMMCTGMSNLAWAMLVSAQILFLTRDLALPAWAVGVVLAAGGVGGVLGALTAERCARRLGHVRTLWLVPLVTWPAALLVPLAGPGWLIGLFVVGLCIRGFGFNVFNVAQVSYRQVICPDRLLGRMNASVRFVVWGAMPLGGLLGGLLGTWIGVRATLWVCCVAMVAALLPLLLSPLVRLRELPGGPTG
ncbi:MFS transporter [Lentzea sp. NBRC 105346]|uniref:MFS transporter n=1 Tax=Lentzea sp. NBRC 105346 TaxID=3032205 RepID=UPI0024A27746|nr:MFS transporter [Lentzea sp. NBRC 105346]GLZ33802.1 MFS transporter [Lentzea sp. NBRC 105346]